MRNAFSRSRVSARFRCRLNDDRLSPFAPSRAVGRTHVSRRRSDTSKTSSRPHATRPRLVREYQSDARGKLSQIKICPLVPPTRTMAYVNVPRRDAVSCRKHSPPKGYKRPRLPDTVTVARERRGWVPRRLLIMYSQKAIVADRSIWGRRIDHCVLHTAAQNTNR